jgi:hypothetical protein
LETCTGGGYTTITLARTAKYVFTVEIDESIQKQAVDNVEKAGLSTQVSFIHGSILDQNLLYNLLPVDAAFIDPDWAATGPDHVYRFIHSNTKPPADTVLSKIFEITENVAIVPPPFIEAQECNDLPEHEREKLYLGENHELYCLYFENLITSFGETEFRIPIWLALPKDLFQRIAKKPRPLKSAYTRCCGQPGSLCGADYFEKKYITKIRQLEIYEDKSNYQT